jgi:GTPase SAR1 family protein
VKLEAIADTKVKIVVIGDTSTGKSSVLQALTRLPFPVAGDLCTRFVTETTIRRCNPSEGQGPGYKIEVKMDPASSIQAAPFLPKTYESDDWVEVYQHLREDIDDAFDKMSPAYLLPPGVSHIGMQTRQGSGTAGARQLPLPQLLKHRLQITVRKPNQAHFSIVDVPGLVSSKPFSKLQNPSVVVSSVAAKLTQRQMGRQSTSNCLWNWLGSTSETRKQLFCKFYASS